MLAAIHSVSDGDQARQAALEAHRQQHGAWAQALGGVVRTAALTGGTHLTQAAQSVGVAVPDYAPQDDDPESPDAWATANQGDIATSVQHHTGQMIAAALALALLGGGTSAPSGHHVTLSLAVSVLYDQWTGQVEGAGDYSEQLAGDLTTMGWGMGQQASMGQITDSGQWSSQKTWNAVGDNRTRTSHLDVDGVTVDASDTFNVGGEDLDYPGMPGGSNAETSGCRCWLTWALVNNVTGETIDSDAPDGEG